MYQKQHHAKPKLNQSQIPALVGLTKHLLNSWELSADVKFALSHALQAFTQLSQANGTYRRQRS